MPKFVTYSAYLNHWLFKAIRKTAMRNNNNKCGYCGDNATEVHHLKYPKPWGAFDVPNNLQPVCHSCHCKIEGKIK